MLIDIPMGKGPGTWRRLLCDEYGDHPKWSAIITCPDCQTKLPIVNHNIDKNGQVTPSVGHPQNPSCPWHPPSPRLLGWSPLPLMPTPLPYHFCTQCDKKSRQLGGWGVAGGLLCSDCMAKLLGN